MAVIVYPWCNDVVAHRRGVPDAVHGVADDRAAVARGVLLAHRAEGYAEITVTRGVTDSFVTLRDRPAPSNKNRPAAAAIEFGNRYGGGGIGALSKAFGL